MVALSLIMTIFTEPAERAKAMGIFGFVLSGGGTAGVLLGGVLTDLFAWNWIFLVNLPIGIAVFVLSLSLLPDDRGNAEDGRLDVAGAVTVTAAVMLGTYAVINGNENGWTSGRRSACSRAAAALFAVFITVESRVGSPLMPLGLFRLRNIRVANVVGALMAASMFGWFFLAALYLQLVLGYSPLEVGLAFLPTTLDHGRRLDRPVRPPGDALRRQAADRGRADLLRDRSALVHPGPRRRQTSSPTCSRA